MSSRLIRDLTTIGWSTRCRWLIVSLVLSSLTLLHAQTPERDQKLGRISGLVVSAHTGQPLKGALFSIMGQSLRRIPGHPYGKPTRTGFDGTFQLTDIPPGRYYYACKKSGYEAGSGPSGHVDVGEGESVEGMVIQLRRSGVIAGRFVDSDGEPLPQAQVQAYRQTFGREGARLRPAATAMTDDRGMYRIFRLEPGKYVVGVRPLNELRPRGELAYEYAGSFYPNAMTATEAVVLKVDWGQELGNIDLQVAAAPGTLLVGTVFNGVSGRPCRGCVVSITAGDGTVIGTVNPNKAGLFSIAGLQLGSYQLDTRFNDGDRLFGKQHLLVAEERTYEVELVAHRLQVVEGTVVAGKPPPGHTGSEGRVGGFIVQLGRIGAGRGHSSGPILPTGGRFRFQEVAPGAYRVGLRSMGTSFYLKNLLLGGRRLAKPEISVTSDGSLPSLTVDASADGASVTGTVEPGRGQAADVNLSDAIVAIFPRAGGNPYMTDQTDRLREGFFNFRGLAPGSYTLFAMPRQDAFNLYDPEVRRALQSRGKVVNLSPEEEASVELTLIPEP